MSIRPDELAELVLSEAVGATSSDALPAQAVAAALISGGQGADLDSETSLSLKSAITALSAPLGAGVTDALAGVEIYGVDSPYINAIPTVRKGVERIIVFDGLKHLIHYYADLIKVLDLLQRIRPEARIRFSDGEDIEESLAFSMAGFSILADVQQTFRQPPLIHDMLGPQAQREVRDGFVASVAFVILHELAHIRLGHLGMKAVYSERQSWALAEPESLAAVQANELEADAFALSLIPPANRALFAPSLAFLFGGFAFLEAFGASQATHPLAVNRLSSLMDICDMPEADKAIMMSWVDGQAEGYRRMADDRAESGGSVRHRIHEAMPLDLAYAIVAEVKARVANEHGSLDASTEGAGQQT